MQLKHMAGELRRLENELQVAFSKRKVETSTFYGAMRHFLLLKDELFPEIPGEPAFRLLMTLAETPPGRAQSSVSGIAYGAGVPLTTAVRYIALMEAENIVERRPDPDDGRRFLIQLTPMGRRRLEELAGHWSFGIVILAVIPLALLAHIIFR